MIQIKSHLTPTEKQEFDKLMKQKNDAIDNGDMKLVKKIQKKIIDVLKEPEVFTHIVLKQN